MSAGPRMQSMLSRVLSWGGRGRRQHRSRWRKRCCRRAASSACPKTSSKLVTRAGRERNPAALRRRLPGARRRSSFDVSLGGSADGTVRGTGGRTSRCNWGLWPAGFKKWMCQRQQQRGRRIVAGMVSGLVADHGNERAEREAADGLDSRTASHLTAPYAERTIHASAGSGRDGRGQERSMCCRSSGSRDVSHWRQHFRKGSRSWQAWGRGAAG